MTTITSNTPFASLVSGDLEVKVGFGSIADVYFPAVTTGVGSGKDNPIEATIAGFVANVYFVDIGRALPSNVDGIAFGESATIGVGDSDKAVDGVNFGGKVGKQYGN